MPLVRNRSEVPHRYLDYARKAYLVWAPGETRDVPDAVAGQVCQAHPDKMELYVPEPAVTGDIAELMVDRAQRGGSRRAKSTTRKPVTRKARTRST